MISDVRPDEARARRAPIAAEVRDARSRSATSRRALVQPERVRGGVPEEQRQHDRRRSGSRIRSASPRCAALGTAPAARPCGSDRRVRDPGEHEHREHVDQPARTSPDAPSHGSVEPRSTARDHRHHDRREEHEEAPEDEGVHQPGHEPLEELPLPEHDHDLVARAPRQVAASGRSACRVRTSLASRSARRANRPPQTASAAASPSDAGEHRYGPRPFPARRVIAGTISWRSPITA